jgi:signal transduction histidine kinase
VVSDIFLFFRCLLKIILIPQEFLDMPAFASCHRWYRGLLISFLRISVILAFLPAAIFSQARLDSVLATLSHVPDSTKIRTLNDLCWKNRANDPQFSEVCGEKALELCQMTGDKVLLARTLNLLGISNRVLGYYDKSLAYLRSALAIAEETNNTIEIGFSENNIAGSYRLKGYYTAAMQHVLRGLKAFESIQYKYGIAYSAFSVASIYEDQMDYPKALEYFNRAYQVRLEIGDTAGAGNALNEIAKTFALQNNFERAFETFKQAELLFIKSHDRSGLINNSTALSDVFIRLGRYSEALPLHQKVYELAKELQVPRGIVVGATRLGVIYTYLHQFPMAERYLQIAQQKVQTLQEYALTLEVYKAQSLLYEAEGKYVQSLKYARLYNTLKDSVLSRESVSGVKEMEAVYESEKAKAENVILQKNVELLRTQRNSWVVITILFIGISGLILWRYLYQKQAEERIRKINSELKALNETRDKFFSIIAHDLRSPFHMMLGISELLATDIDTLPPAQIKKFSKELHNGIKKQFELLSDLLEWSRLQRGDLSIEKKELRLDTEIREVVDSLTVPLRMKEISLFVDVPDSAVVLADTNMFRLVLRNLIANAIKFTGEKGEIFITAERQGETIKMNVRDTGVGISAEDIEKLFRSDIRFTTLGTANEKGTGLGLLLCKEIVEKHGGNIHVLSEAGKGSTFSFTVSAAY